MRVLLPNTDDETIPLKELPGGSVFALWFCG
jgi:hypothetical protein